MSEVVINVTKVEEVVTINATPNVTQILVNTNSGGGIPEAPIDGNLYGRKNATWEQVTSGGGIPDAPNDANAYVRSALGWVVGYTKSAIDTLLGNKVDKVSGKGLSQEDYTTAEKSKLASITEIFTTALKTTYDDAVTWITTNGTNILNHIASTSNPHNVTKSQVGLSNVVNADTTTTANITDSTNKRFVTDANLVVIGNTSGTNSGDNATNTTSNSYADAKVVAELASFKTANFLDFTSSGQTQLNGKVDKTDLDPLIKRRYFDDLQGFGNGAYANSIFFGNGNLEYEGNVFITRIGTGATFARTPAEVGRGGIIRGGTGTTSGGLNLIQFRSIWLGTEDFVIQTAVRIQNLSDATNRFTLVFTMV